MILPLLLVVLAVFLSLLLSKSSIAILSDLVIDGLFITIFRMKRLQCFVSIATNKLQLSR